MPEVVDGLVGFKGSMNLTNAGLSRAARGLDISEVVTDFAEVTELNNKWFAPVWRRITHADEAAPHPLLPPSAANGPGASSSPDCRAQNGASAETQTYVSSGGDGAAPGARCGEVGFRDAGHAGSLLRPASDCLVLAPAAGPARRLRGPRRRWLGVQSLRRWSRSWSPGYMPAIMPNRFGGR
jgi:hypothetical protein